MDQGLQAKLPLSPVLKKDLKLGDHIAVRRNIENLHPSLKSFYRIIGKFYFHHGIYIGNDEVIDFAGNTKRDARPRRVDILEFLDGSCGSNLYRVDEGDDEDDGSPVPDVDGIIRRAFEVMEDPSKWPGYNVILNNCESFAYYLKTGKARTEQGMNALERALGTGAAALGLLAVVIGGIAAIAVSTRRGNRKH